VYSTKVLDHFHHPRHLGEIAQPSAVIEVTNPVCGDVLKLWVVASGEVIAEAKFKVAGCVPAVACGSWLAEWLQGRPLKDFESLSPSQIEGELGGLPPASKHASVLAVEALGRLMERLTTKSV
jgi:nitrogen fixation protein NifU and related proteins